MSVAFRRDSDEEHLEPKFELPLPPGPNLVTARGLALIEAKAEALEAAVAGEADEPARAVLKRELRYWNTRRATAIVAPIPNGEEVAFGARVTFRLNGAERTIDLVGSDEADPAANRIPFTAPLAAAMMGAGAGELLDFNGRLDAIEILAIDSADANPERESRD
ncbi:MAG: GreA/GreB family elongation factor [Sphingomonas bacterium]